MDDLMSARDELWTVYLVWWPRLGVLKVGRTQRTVRRVAENRTGLPDRIWSLVTARLDGEFPLDATQVNERDQLGVVEDEILAGLRARFLPAFASEAEAARLLPGGRGWTECVRVENEADYQAARDLFDEGVAAHADESAAMAATVRLHRPTGRTPSGCGAGHDVGLEVVRGRRGARGGQVSEDACAPVRVRRVDHDLGSRIASPCFGRGALVAPVCGQSGAEPASDSGVACGAAPGQGRFGLPAAGGLHEAFTKVSGDLHGRGERESASERECERGGVGERGRARERRAPFTNLDLRTASARAFGAVPVLLTAPTVRHRGRVRPVRYGTGSPSYLASGEPRGVACSSFGARPAVRARPGRARGVHHPGRPHRPHLASIERASA